MCFPGHIFDLTTRSILRRVENIISPEDKRADMLKMELDNQRSHCFQVE